LSTFGGLVERILRVNEIGGKGLLVGVTDSYDLRFRDLSPRVEVDASKPTEAYQANAQLPHESPPVCFAALN
jgi:hypothetical protein